MSIENNHRPSENEVQKFQQNPLTWRGDQFEVIIKEDEREGETHLVLGVMDSNNEIVVIDFTEHVRKSSTTFLPKEEVALFDLEATPGSPPLPSDTEQIFPHVITPVVFEAGVSGTPQSPETNQVSPTPTPEKVEKDKTAPTKITGKIIEVGELGKTKKQEKPMLLFRVWDTENKVERRMVAFETLAEQLASPDTDLQPYEDISLLAHRHVNTIHVHGKQKDVEDWYIQSANYHDKRYEKPRGKQKKG